MLHSLGLEKQEPPILATLGTKRTQTGSWQSLGAIREVLERIEKHLEARKEVAQSSSMG